MSGRAAMDGLLPVRLPAEPIVAERLALVPVDAALVDALLSGRADVAGGTGWPDAETTLRLQLAADAGAGASPYWVVHSGGEVIGDCTAHGGPDDNGSVEVGYALAAPYRGRGLGTELVAAVTDWLLAQDGVLQVRATTSPDNTASRRCLERAGFSLDGAEPHAVTYVRSTDS